jgi:hypothetical protein
METTMSRKKPSISEFVSFDVLYEDGSRTSNHKVPSSELSSFDGDAPARTIIEAQDQKIGALSGRPRGTIKSIARSQGR